MKLFKWAVNVSPDCDSDNMNFIRQWQLGNLDEWQDYVLWARSR